MGGVVETIGNVVEDTVDAISDVGSEIDDFVNEEIPGGWYTVGAAAGGSLLAPELLAAETAGTGAFDAGLGLDAMSGGAGTVVSGGSLLSPYELAQSNIDPALLEGMSQADVTQAAIQSPYYAAAQSNIDPLLLEGMTAQQVATSPVLTSAVIPNAAATGTFGLRDVFRATQLANNLFARPYPQQVNPYQLMQQQQAGLVDYSPTLNLLATRSTPQSLV